MARRRVLAGAAGLASLGLAPAVRASGTGASMYGLIGKMTALPGQRDALTAILLESLGTMPGCLSYIVAHDPADDAAIWVTEVWTDEASHRASLQGPEVKAAIARGLPLIATFDDAQMTAPVGGVGLATTQPVVLGPDPRTGRRGRPGVGVGPETVGHRGDSAPDGLALGSSPGGDGWEDQSAAVTTASTVSAET